MRRKDKKIINPVVIEQIITQSQVCRLAMVDGSSPYIVPLSFGYKGNALYFHSALKGRKIDILRNNSSVCFELDLPGDLIQGEQACKWSVKYQSVIGLGTVEFLVKTDEKRDAFCIIMDHYSDKEFQFSDEQLQTVAVFKVKILKISAKQSGY